MELMPDQYIQYLMSPEVGFSKSHKIADDLHEKKGEILRDIYSWFHYALAKGPVRRH